MHKFLLTICLSAIVFTASSQCNNAIDLNTWIKGGQPGNGNWVVTNGGSQVHQTINGDPTFFYSPFNMMNVHISGRFKTTDTDDDYMGFVFSFLNPLGATDSFDCWLFDWKQQQQGGAPPGKSLDRVNGYIPSSQYTNVFWDHNNTPEFTVVQNTFGGSGWQWNHYHDFDLYLTYTRAQIYIDGVLTFDWTDCYKPGRFGFYNLSQQDCYYDNFSYSLFVDFTFSQDKICLGQSTTLQFATPCVTSFQNQYTSLTWDFGDGNTQTVTNPTPSNCNISHTYAAAGVYNAKLTLTDNNGCTTTSTAHSVDVRSPLAINPTIVSPTCNGLLNGAINTAVTGGFGNYNYLWSSGVTAPNYQSIAAGTYTLTVVDGPCSATGTYTITQPTALTAVTSHTDANCNGSNGSCTITISGGTPPYSGVSWGGIPGYTVNNLPQGTYIADFHDANGCSSLNQYREIVGNLPCGLSATATTVDVSCNGGNNGSATLTVTGGSPPATITWTGGGSGATVTGLAAGTYTYNYTDQNAGHAFSGTVTINQPAAPMVATVATTALSCAGSNNGSAIASVTSGGYPPYTYSWSQAGHGNNPVASNLAPGAITVTITDSHGCTATASGTVSSVPSLNASITKTDDVCFHSRRGSAIVHVSGGIVPYTYIWNNLVTDTGNMAISAGTYSVTVTDNNGCTVTASTVVNGPPQLIMSYTDQKIKCYGANTGSFNITVSGGTPAYTYTWNQPSASGSNPTGLAPGDYAFTVTDANGCSVLGEDTLTQPASALSALTSHTNVNCHGGSDGTVTINLSGGTPPYTYLGNPIPAGTTTLTGLPAGTYAGNIIDSNSCTVAVSETITEPGVQSLTLTPVANTCFGGTAGSITATFVNGTGNITYNWNPGGNQPSPYTGLAAGTYTVTATDANNCTASGSTTVNQPTAISVSIAKTDVLCFGGSSGTATLTVSGGTGPNYTYVWSPNVSNSNTASSLAANTYQITITDQAQCTKDTFVTISQPAAALNATLQTTDVTCFGLTDGTIAVNATGGTPNYTYAWNPNVGSSANATGLGASSYNVTVTDANSCSTSQSATINAPASALAVAPTQVNLTCYGASNGSATVNASGGTSPYTYLWSPNVSTADNATSLIAGTYNVTVNDNHMCSITTTFNITQPPVIAITINKVDELCFGDAIGSITLTVSGGTGTTYGYTWNPNVSTTNTASNLTANTYFITVTDQAQCNKDTSVTITQPAAPVSATVQFTDVTCFGLTDGTITITPAGGTPGYTYSWNPNVSSGNTATGLGAGSYSVTITDANSCSTSQTATISAPASALSVAPTHTDLTCYQVNVGTAAINAAGGTPAYTYTWNPNVSTADNASSLAAATYNVTVTDAHLCTITTTFTVTQPPQLIVTSTEVNNRCYGDATASITLNASGGTPGGGYVYTWNPSVSTTNSATNLTAGNYAYTVTDANNCTVVQSVSIVDPAKINLAIASGDPHCFNESTGFINATAQGGITPYNFTLDNGTTQQTSAGGQFPNIPPGTYTVSVTDNNSCSSDTTVILNNPSQITDQVTEHDVTCYHSTDGQIIVTAAGGTPGYTFALSTGPQNTSGTFTGLIPNPYSITITDANNCTITDTTTVNEPDSVLVTVMPDSVELKLGQSIQLQSTTNQSGLVTYTWLPPYGLSCYDCPNPTFSGNTSANYNVTAVNTNGCQGTAVVVVEVVPEYNIFIPNVFTPNGDGANDQWRIFGNLDGLKQFNIILFNRIGEKVFETDNINFGWDGMYKGAPAPAGVYTYVAHFVWLNNHSDSNYKGSLTILR